MKEEPLSAWLKRRDEKIGLLREVFIDGEGRRRATHVHPDKPRAIEQWNGHAWELLTVVPNLAAAKQVMYPESAKTSNESASAPLKVSTGRHRKPPRS
ncbi:DUF6087 family protein [Streptomyces sp. CA-294286]|uniref:DUF6087 family protein n=1 Tax=Streptomyces sp. CA-294286 TaxID=3240070 RepID=UPI003D91C310